MPSFRIKANLYHQCETRALLDAIRESKSIRDACSVECVMVGDSYLTTHLGRSSTKLESVAEQRWFANVMAKLVCEVREELDNSRVDNETPYLIADMPDGSTKDINVARRIGNKFIENGANALKLEITSQQSFEILECLAMEGFRVLAHLGYTPQFNQGRRYGNSVHEALELFAVARRARDSGAYALILERVNELVTRQLAVPNKNSLPLYHIFCGNSGVGGLSINLWDASVLPPTKKIFFPPTADMCFADYPEKYTVERIKKNLTRLLELVIDGQYPRSPRNTLSAEDQSRIHTLDPWREPEFHSHLMVKR